MNKESQRPSRRSQQRDDIRHHTLLVLAKMHGTAAHNGHPDVIDDELIADILLAASHEDVRGLTLSAEDTDSTGVIHRFASWHALVNPRANTLLPHVRRHDTARLRSCRMVVHAEFGKGFDSYRTEMSLDWSARCYPLIDDTRSLGEVMRVPGKQVPGSAFFPDGVGHMLWRPNHELELHPGDWVTATIAGWGRTCFAVRALDLDPAREDRPES